MPKRGYCYDYHGITITASTVSAYGPQEDTIRNRNGRHQSQVADIRHYRQRVIFPFLFAPTPVNSK